jgi:retinol dehydrogenase 12
VKDLFRDQGSAFQVLINHISYPPMNGAYMEIWADLSPVVRADKSVSYSAQFERFYPICSDLEAAVKLEGESGKGSDKKFWEWSEEQVNKFV